MPPGKIFVNIDNALYIRITENGGWCICYIAKSKLGLFQSKTGWIQKQ